MRRTQNIKKMEKAFVRMYREDAMSHQNSKCTYCKEGIKRIQATADHLTSRKNGGATIRENIKAACFGCNITKGSLNEKEFRKIVQSKVPPRGGKYFLPWLRHRFNTRLEKFELRVKKLIGAEI